MYSFNLPLFILLQFTLISNQRIICEECGVLVGEPELSRSLSGKNPFKNNSKIIAKNLDDDNHAASKEFPWIVSLQTMTKNEITHICEGTIIADQFVITSASCVSKFGPLSKEYTVKLGSSYWRRGKDYNVIEILKHSEFDPEKLRNNIAILKISPPIDFKKEQTVPICLLPNRSVKVYGNCATAGWLLSSSEDKTPNEFLKRADIEILKDSNCSTRYKDYDSKSMICAGKFGELGDLACEINSASPLQCKFDDNKIYLIGHGSFGETCGQKEHPAVYTRESEYIEWIQNAMKELIIK